LDLSSHPGAAAADPYSLVGEDLAGLNASIRSILGVDHPVLSRVAQYFFAMEGGKKMRPAMVLLMSHAVNAHMEAERSGVAAAAGSGAGGEGEATRPPPQGLVLNSVAGVGGFGTSSQTAVGYVAAEGVTTLPSTCRTHQPVLLTLPPHVVLPLQKRLAEITEMIHTASLLHDDVIDGADTRRGVQSVNQLFGNKLAVLAGDFLLARASVCLARLRNIPVVELLSTVIEQLVKGEVMQMRSVIQSQAPTQAAMDLYLRKT